MDPNLPARLDRATFDRVLQRAAELQVASKDIGEGLSEDDILALGVEVGIPAAHLRQALLEERTRVALPEPTGLLDRWIAPADFVAQRVVQGTPELVGAALAKWLERQEQLVVQRGSVGRITFEPMESFARGMRRLGAAFDPSRGKAYLSKAELVTAVITPLEAGFCHVSLAATLRKSRASYTGGGVAIGLCGPMIGGIVIAIGAPLVVAALPVAAFGWAGLAVARVFRGQAHHAQLGLERALDALERTPALPKAPVPQIGVGQVIKGIAQEVRKAMEE